MFVLHTFDDCVPSKVLQMQGTILECVCHHIFVYFDDHFFEPERLKVDTEKGTWLTFH